MIALVLGLSAGVASYGDELWNAAKEPVTTVLKWLVYALLLLAAIGLVFLIRRAWRYLPPRRGTVVSLEDLSAEPRERQAASHVLSRQLLAEITALSSPGDRGRAELDESRDLDRSFVASMTIAGDGVERLDSLMQGETAVSLGPLSFNVRQLAYFFGTFFRRRSEHELVGSLTPSRHGVVLTVESRGPDQALARWQIDRPGKEATSDAIRDVAMQVVVSLGCSTATSDWRSFRDYRTALDLLGAEGDARDPRESLEEARKLLVTSLDRDPLNPLARFYLGTVERKLGENQAAVEQFRLLEGFVADDKDGRLGRFVEEVHPELGAVLRYNLAVSLLKLDARQDQREALKLLNRLRDRLAGGELGLEPASRYRFEVLLKSALAWALTFELERERETKQTTAWPSDRAYKIRSEIEDQVKSIRRDLPATSEDAASYANALATAENARGRALDSLGRKPNAVDSYRRAIALLPDFVDAQLNLAEVQFELKEGFDWVEQAERAVQQALRIDPSSRRAEYLYGRLCADPSVGRYDDAKTHLQKAGDYSQALILQAALLEQDDDWSGALRLLEQAAAARPGVGYRLLAYSEFVLRLAQQGRATRESLERARRRAVRLARDGPTEGGFRDRGSELVTEIDAALQKLGQEQPGGA